MPGSEPLTGILPLIEPESLAVPGLAPEREPAASPDLEPVPGPEPLTSTLSLIEPEPEAAPEEEVQSWLAPESPVCRPPLLAVPPPAARRPQWVPGARRALLIMGVLGGLALVASGVAAVLSGGVSGRTAVVVARSPVRTGGAVNDAGSTASQAQPGPQSNPEGSTPATTPATSGSLLPGSAWAGASATTSATSGSLLPGSARTGASATASVPATPSVSAAPVAPTTTVEVTETASMPGNPASVPPQVSPVTLTVTSPAPPQAISGKVYVSATAQSVSAGPVTSGQSVVVAASGAAGYGYEGAADCQGMITTNPDGLRFLPGGGTCSKKYDPVAGVLGSAPVGALLARVDNSDWVMTGADGSFVAATSGTLEFAMNDQVRSDNIGGYTVTYRIAN